jgi:hypothetical protein
LLVWKNFESTLLLSAQMKSKILTLAFLVFISLGSAHACDICGGFSGAQSLGLLPSQQQHFLGLRSGTGKFHSYDPFIDNWTYKETDVYYFAELRGRYVINDKWQLHAFLPYLFLQKSMSYQSDKSYNEGWGDMGLQVAYRWELRAQEEEKAGHQLMLSGGLKLPTGKQTVPQGSNAGWIPNLQPGTGATDALLSLNYILQAKAWGLSAEQFTRLNGTNDQSYRFGNRFNTTLRGFYRKALDPLGKIRAVPSLGLAHEYLQTDTQFGLERTYSGGYTLSGTAGIDFFTRSFHLSFHYFAPFSHRLAKGHVRPLHALQASLSYLF